MFDKTDVLEKSPVHEGHNVERFRKIFNKTQTDMSVETGIPQQTISDIEKEPVIKDQENLKKIAKALNIPVEAIKNMPDDFLGKCVNYHFGNGDINVHHRDIIGTSYQIETQINVTGEEGIEAAKAAKNISDSYKTQIDTLKAENERLKKENEELKNGK